MGKLANVNNRLNNALTKEIHLCSWKPGFVVIIENHNVERRITNGSRRKSALL